VSDKREDDQKGGEEGELKGAGEREGGPWPRAESRGEGRTF